MISPLLIQALTSISISLGITINYILALMDLPPASCALNISDVQTKSRHFGLAIPRSIRCEIATATKKARRNAGFWIFQ